MKDEISREIAEERANERAVATKDAKLEDIRNIMQKLKYTADQAMDLLGISQEARGMYSSML